MDVGRSQTMKGSIDREKEYRNFQNAMKSDIMLYFKNLSLATIWRVVQEEVKWTWGN